MNMDDKRMLARHIAAKQVKSMREELKRQLTKLGSEEAAHALKGWGFDSIEALLTAIPAAFRNTRTSFCVRYCYMDGEQERRIDLQLPHEGFPIPQGYYNHTPITIYAKVSAGRLALVKLLHGEEGRIIKMEREIKKLIVDAVRNCRTYSAARKKLAQYETEFNECFGEATAEPPAPLPKDLKRQIQSILAT